MQTLSKPKVSTETKKKSKLKIIIIAIIILFVSLFLIFDLLARYKFASLKNEVEKVQQDVMAPLGAVRQPSRSPSGGDGLLSTLNCWPDTQCPFVYGGWVVPIEAGAEGKLMKSILEREGYTLDQDKTLACIDAAMRDVCEQAGTKGTQHLRVNVYKADIAHFENIPKKDISPKIWRYVQIYVTDYKSYPTP